MYFLLGLPLSLSVRLDILSTRFEEQTDGNAQSGYLS